MDYLSTRLLCSFLVGVILSQTGSFIQLGTRNILASPSTLGFDGLAILWLLIFHSLTIFSQDSSAISFILLGAPMFIGVGFLFSRFLNGSIKFERIILLGLTFNLLVGAVFSLWQFFFLAFNLPFPVELWFGHFRFASAENLQILFLAEVVILAALFWRWKDLLLYSLGSSLAKNLNLKEKGLFSFLFISVAVGTFVVVGLFGAFSFLGLIFPIISRRLWFKRFDLSGEILLGAIVNGLALMLIDTLCYFFPILGAEVPVGLIVTAIGAVSLILLLWRSDSRELLAKSRK
jgi:iron complex transport system permease protein